MAREVATDIPASEVRRHLRRSWYTGGVVFAIAVVLGGWGIAEWRQERVLDDGPRTQAEVVDTDNRRRRPDVVVVRYQVEGRRYQEELPADIDGLEPGDRIEIIYEPSDPSHARPAGEWSPTFQFLWLVAGFIAVIGVAGGIYERYQARAAIRALEGGTKRRMWVRHFRRWSWAQRGHQHLAALWESESEPPAEQLPVLVVEVGSRDVKHLEDGPVVVHGDRQPGGRAIIWVPGRTIWPRSKSRSELPPGAKPV